MSAPVTTARPSTARVTGRVLVVDDQEANRTLLRELLEVQGHVVQEAEDGLAALAGVAEFRPDVVLLDVSMPRMDGFEACRRLKEDPLTSAIPVLLLTAFDDRQHRLTGMNVGANDYLTKPIDTAETSLRVRSAIRMRQLMRQTEEQFTRLQRLERLRDELVRTIVRDLQSPLSGLRVYLRLAGVEARSHGDSALPGLVAEMERIVERMTDLVGGLLSVNGLEPSRMPLDLAPIDLDRVLGEALALVGTPPRGVRVGYVPPPAPVSAVCDKGLVRRVIEYLLHNAITAAPDGGAVNLRVTLAPGGPRVEVGDEGPAIPPEEQDRIFDTMGPAEPVQPGRRPSGGHGLAFCHLAVSAHGGQIGVESTPPSGVTFWFTLPWVAQPPVA